MFKGFVFYDEGALTSPNGLLHHFYYRDDLPIMASRNHKDLVLDIDWDTEDVRGILENLARLGVIDLNVSMDELVENLKDKPVYFNGSLSLYCNLNLGALKSLSKEIEIASFYLRNIYGLKDFSDFLPEFLLNFGEGLEEKGTLCWVGGMGVLGGNYINNNRVRGDLQYLCSAYMSLEYLEYILEHFDVLKVEEQFREFISMELGNFDLFKKDYVLNFSSLKGVDNFRSRTLERYASKLPYLDLNMDKLSGPHIFYGQGVEIDVMLHLKNVFGTEANRILSIIQVSCYNNQLNKLVYKGNRHPANVWWAVDDFKINSQNPSNCTMVIYPRFG